jgi:putative dehydrogenase
MVQRVGFIGLGVLGSAMAANLLKEGFAVVGYDISADAMASLAQDGLEVATSPRDAAERSEVVVTCLPSPAALHEVCGGDNGIAAANDGADSNGQIVVETSTFAIADKERARDTLAATGRITLDCPVSGNRILAVKKQLTAFCSGDPSAYETVKAVLDGFAHRVFHVGEFGNGMKMKFCGNILNLVHNSVAAEVMVLGMKAGLDPAMVHEVISGSGSSSSMFETRGALMVKNDYDHEGMNFSIPLKDSWLITEHARAHNVPIPIYQTALQPYFAAVSHGLAHLDQSAVCRVLEMAANCERPHPDSE